MEPGRDWEALEIDLLLEGIYHRYGFDFRGYARAPLKDKLHALLRVHAITTISALQDKVLHDAQIGESVLCALQSRDDALSDGLFDDPAHIKLLRDTAIPWLRSHPSPSIWIPECISPQEVCTLAILLEEENIYEKTQIFVTGANEHLLQQASTSGVALNQVNAGAERHRLSGGTQPLSDYFQIDSGRAILAPQLRANITWAQFNLQTDASFNEFQLILCRHTLSDFGASLQQRVLRLFYESLPMFGLLSIDNAEKIEQPPFSSWYKSISTQGNLFKRVI